MFRKKTLAEAAAETTHTAAEKGQAALEVTLERVIPLLEQAAEKLAPYAEDAKDKAQKAGQQAASFAATKIDDWQPQINDALDKVSPAVEKAQKSLQDDLIPKLVDLLHQAADLPAVEQAKEIASEAQSRGEAAVAALSGELTKPKKGGKLKTVGKVAAVGALVAAVAVAVKTFLGSKDSGWSAHEPSPAYTYTDVNTAAAGSEARLTDEGGPVAEPRHAHDDEGGEISETDVPGATYDDAAPTEATETTDEVHDDAEGDAATSPTYGEGSYIGDEPPEGYTIKGNERSMKYHTTESGGYERTIADVWFNSEEAAQAAGFTRAQR